MLQITLPYSRMFDEETEEFVVCAPTTIKLEHSLISIQRWESKWHKSYLNTSAKTKEEWLDYIRCMSLDPNIDLKTLNRLSFEDAQRIKEYVDDKMTATTFSKRSDKPNRSIITAELIYYWMITFNIPFECSKWHLNQLLTLIQVCALKNNPKKMNKRDAARERMAMNKARRQRIGSAG